LLDDEARQRPPHWQSLARPALFVPITRTLDEVLHAFQHQHRHLGIVVDEYGGTAGLVTLEDLIEEIVGDIQDEHDEDEDRLYERLDEQTLRVDARLNLDDVNELLALEDTPEAIDTDALDFETVGGLVYHLTGDVPEVGTEVRLEALSFRVEAVENYRIGQVLVRLGPERSEQVSVAT
jgi:CBS domain containing-hemolysin-like protein